MRGSISGLKEEGVSSERKGEWMEAGTAHEG
jgi:hypothetical protein